MKATVLYRIASGLLVVFAAGNTYGLLNFWRVAGPMSPERFPFPVGHMGLSYAQVVLGLDLICSLYILLAAYLAWHLGAVARTTPQAIGAMGWVLFAYQLMWVYISMNVLSGIARMLAAAIAICLGWAAWLSRGAPPASVEAK